MCPMHHCGASCSYTSVCTYNVTVCVWVCVYILYILIIVCWRDVGRVKGQEWGVTDAKIK
jgi:hypothetical protein